MKKLLLAFTVICLTFHSIAFAQFDDIEGHWAQGTIEKWSEMGIIQGYDDNTVRPDGDVTAAELCSLINRFLGVSLGDAATFSDVAETAWYYEDVAGAEVAGYIENDGREFEPDTAITRERAVGIISKAFMLTLDNEDTTLPFSDVSEESEYYEAIKTMYGNGLIKGKSANSFEPDASLTRGEIFTFFDRIVAEYHNSYSDIESKGINGSLMIIKSNISVKDTTINGDLFISRGVNGGEIRLENVTVNGKIYFCGGEDSVIIIKNSSIDKIVADTRGARVILYQNSTVNNVESYGELTLSEIFATGGGFSNVTIKESGILSISGRVENCTVAAFSTVHVMAGGEINEIIIEKTADGTEIISEGNISKVLNHASKITINGETKSSGTVTNIKSVSTEEGDMMLVAALSAGSTRPRNSYTIDSGFISSGDSSTYLTSLDIKELLSSGLKNFQPAFSSTVFKYEMLVKNSVSELNILPEVSKEQAKIRINGAVASTKNYSSVDLPVGKSDILIEVYLGLSKKCSYTISVERLEPIDQELLRRISEATETITIEELANIGIDGLVPQQLDTYKAAISDAVVKNGGNILTDDEIQVIVNHCNETVAELGSLTVTNSSVYTNGYNLMVHDFSTSQTRYMAYVDKTVSDVDINITKLHEDSVVKINGREASSGAKNNVSGLRAGENVINIDITSADGLNSKRYTVIVDKDKDSSIIANSNFGSGTSGWSLGKSSPANGSLNLTRKPGWVTVERTAEGTAMWQLGIKSSTFDVPQAAKVTIEFLASTVGGVEGEVDRTINVMRKIGSGSELSAVEGNGSGNVEIVNGKPVSYTFSTGGNASAGLTTCYIYIQTGNSKGNNEPDVMFKYIRVSYEGADGALQSLNIVGGGVPIELSPSFSPEITSYTASVPDSTSQLIVTALGLNAGTTVKVNGDTSELNFVPIEVGQNTIEVQGTSPTGNVKKYTVQVTREE